MPQAPTHLQARWGSDAEAFAQLRNNFTDRAGMLRPRPGYKPTQDDYSAIDYLVLEWDYGYDGKAA